MRSISLTTAIWMAIVAFPATLAATTLERLSMNDLSDQSTVVVVGKVLNGGGELKDGAVYTHYQLSVSDVWKGSAGSQLDVYVPGGTASGFRQLVPGAPVLTVGSEYVVFLWVGRSGRAQIMGLSQGLFAIAADSASTAKYAERPGVKEMMVDPLTGRPVTDETVRMKAADLKALVRKRQGDQ